jgi:hypothetical protein
MHAVRLLHKHLQQACPTIHARRLAVLMAATHTLAHHQQLTITALGRALDSEAQVKHNIKRMDRLAGNTVLLTESPMLYAAVTQWLLGGVSQPIIVVDWSDLTPDRQWQLLRAAIPVGGRTLTIYEEIHPQKTATSRRVHRAFLKTLKALLPPTICPIIVTDAGFRTPWFNAVRALGWHWVGRIRNRDMIQFAGKNTWFTGKLLYAKATRQPKGLGEALWVRSNPIPCHLYLVRKPKQGRINKSVFGDPVRAKHSQKHASREREPWLLAASPGLAGLTAKAMVAIYQTRMQVEEAFRDIKSERYGLGLSASLTKNPDRLAILLLIGALALFALWLVGSAGVKQNLHHRYQSNTTRHRCVLSTVYFGMQIMRRTPTRFTTSQLLTSIAVLQERLAA